MTDPTPGPWNVCERWPYQPDGLHIEWEQLQHMWIVGIRPGSGIAAIDNAPRENGEANARLIAAAPDLLEACEALLSDRPDTENFMDWMSERETQIRAAIAKARGTA